MLVRRTEFNSRSIQFRSLRTHVLAKDMNSSSSSYRLNSIVLLLWCRQPVWKKKSPNSKHQSRLPETIMLKTLLLWYALNVVSHDPNELWDTYVYTRTHNEVIIKMCMSICTRIHYIIFYEWKITLYIFWFSKNCTLRIKSGQCPKTWETDSNVST